MGARLYVLGHPVAHSKSPAMHNAAYKALGLDWRYGFMDCASEQEAHVFLRAGDWLALNVTMPYKQLALARADFPSHAALLARGANVVVRTEGGVHANNTDGVGCIAYLRRCGVDFKGASVVVCGTGPTSLSIAHAALCAQAACVTLMGRDAAKAEGVVRRYAQVVGNGVGNGVGENVGEGDAARLQAGAYGQDLARISDAAVVIDATPLGMKPGDPAPFDTSALTANTVVMDAVYGHGLTALGRAATHAGCRFFDGSGMLVAQAVETVHDLAHLTGAFSVPDSVDLFDIMAKAAGFAL